MSEKYTRHLHWEFLAFDEVTDTGAVPWGVQVTVLGYLSEPDALMAVKEIVPRREYRLRRVWECTTCEALRSTAKSMKRMVS